MPNVEIDGTNSTVKTNVLTSQSGTTITVPTGKVLTVTDAAGLTIAGNAPLTSIANDSIDSQHYAAASIDNEHLADDAVGVAELSATGTASSSTFLRGDNAWGAAGGGKVLQCLSTNKTDSATTSSTSFVDTGLQVIITPAATTSKIMIWVNIVIGRQTTDKRVHLQLTGGNTASYRGGAGTGHETAFSHVIRSGDAYSITTSSGSYLDAPSSTSAITYKLQWKVESGTFYLNRPYTLDANGANCTSTITAMEIGA